LEEGTSPDGEGFLFYGCKEALSGTSENKEGMKMRKVLLGLLIAAALLVTEAYASLNREASRGSNVPLWEGPRTRGRSSIASRGTKGLRGQDLRVPGQTGWVRVRFGNLTGWVRADLVG
jgi:uncharacterized protein YraI